MSKSLKSMNPDERSKAIVRRIARESGGLGYWAARDAFTKAGLKK